MRAQSHESRGAGMLSQGEDLGALYTGRMHGLASATADGVRAGFVIYPGS